MNTTNSIPCPESWQTTQEHGNFGADQIWLKSIGEIRIAVALIHNISPDKEDNSVHSIRAFAKTGESSWRLIDCKFSLEKKRIHDFLEQIHRSCRTHHSADNTVEAESQLLS